MILPVNFSNKCLKKTEEYYPYFEIVKKVGGVFLEGYSRVKLAILPLIYELISTALLSMNKDKPCAFPTLKVSGFINSIAFSVPALFKPSNTVLLSLSFTRNQTSLSKTSLILITASGSIGIASALVSVEVVSCMVSVAV